MPPQAIPLVLGEGSRVEQEGLLLRADLVPYALVSIPLNDRIGIGFGRDRYHTLKDDGTSGDLACGERTWLIVTFDRRQGRGRRNPKSPRPFLCRRLWQGFFGTCHPSALVHRH